jgi:hypothetical protein
MVTFLYIWLMFILGCLIVGCIRLSFIPYINGEAFQRAFLLTPTDIEMSTYLNRVSAVLVWIVWILINPIIFPLFLISLLMR